MDSLGVDGPSLGWVVLVPPEVNSIVVRVSPALESKSEGTEVHNVLLLVEEDSLSGAVSPWSDHTTTCSCQSGSVLFTDSIVSSVSNSDGFGSSVEDKELSPVPWGMVLDLEHELTVSSLMGRHEQSSSSMLRSELESKSISDRWVLVGHDNSERLSIDNFPSLVGTVVTVPEDQVAAIVVVSSVDIKALSSVVSDVSSVSSIDSESLVDLSSP